jgi:lysozyme
MMRAGPDARRFLTRPRVILLVLLIVLGASAATWWFLWVPNWRPPLREGERYGIDVSAHQDVIDWGRVAQDGMEFAYIKATEGADFIDDRFAENWDGAGEASLDRGVYHFFTLCKPGAIQAQNFLNVAPPAEGALAPAVDLELSGNCSSRPSKVAVDAELREFLTIVEEAWGREVVLYVGDDFESVYPVRDSLDRPLWHRRFLLRPNVEGWLIWQLHGYARVDGVDGGVDLNVMRPVP